MNDTAQNQEQLTVQNEILLWEDKDRANLSYIICWTTES